MTFPAPDPIVRKPSHSTQWFLELKTSVTIMPVHQVCRPVSPTKIQWVKHWYTATFYSLQCFLELSISGPDFISLNRSAFDQILSAGDSRGLTTRVFLRIQRVVFIKGHNFEKRYVVLVSLIQTAGSDLRSRILPALLARRIKGTDRVGQTHVLHASWRPQIWVESIREFFPAIRTASEDHCIQRALFCFDTCVWQICIWRDKTRLEYVNY